MVADLGFNETAKQLNIPHWRIRKWAQRGHWFDIKPAHSQVVQSVQSPSNAHAEALQRYKDESKANLARYAAEASREAAEHPQKLSISRKAKDVADIRASIFPPDTNSSNILQIGFLIGNKEDPLPSIERHQEKPVLGDTLDL